LHLRVLSARECHSAPMFGWAGQFAWQWASAEGYQLPSASDSGAALRATSLSAQGSVSRVAHLYSQIECSTLQSAERSMSERRAIQAQEITSDSQQVDRKSQRRLQPEPKRTMRPATASLSPYGRGACDKKQPNVMIGWNEFPPARPAEPVV
jgi:hypothetical protein